MHNSNSDAPSSLIGPPVVLPDTPSEGPKRNHNVGDWKRVVDVLVRAIIFGHLLPREHLVEDEIMERFKTSRHAVRRAFDDMQRLGVVVRASNRGTWVRSYTLQEVEGLYEVRSTLERQAALRMSLPASKTLIDTLSQIQEQHQAASRGNDLLALFYLNNQFHETLYESCGNLQLSEAIKLYSLQTHPIRVRYFTHEPWREEAIRQHWNMIELLKGSDKLALADACTRHIEPPKQQYLKLYALDDYGSDTSSARP